MASGVSLSSRDIVSLSFWAYRCIELRYIVWNVCTPFLGVPVLLVLILNEIFQNIEHRSCIDQIFRLPFYFIVPNTFVFNTISYRITFSFIDMASNLFFAYRNRIEQVLVDRYRYELDYHSTSMTTAHIIIIHPSRWPNRWTTTLIGTICFLLILNDYFRYISVSIIASKSYRNRIVFF